ncbi:hypothetical protein ACX8Z9_12430 [Arthrobacter halodurans]
MSHKMRGDDIPDQRAPAGATRLQIAASVALLNPAEQMFQAMLDGETGHAGPAVLGLGHR